MRIRFWGTRGSLPQPGHATLRYGGNTSCVEVQANDGTRVILDCGTGAYGLGRALTEGSESVHGHLLIGHTHWDHIQGFPFFAPLFVPGNVWEVYAPGGRGRQLEASLAGQMAYDYFPLTLEALSADVRLHDLKEGVVELGSIRVTTQYLHHPALTLGYRLEADGATLVYATDYEPHSLHPLDAPPGTEPVHHEDRRHIRFLEGADLVIHDAQYTLDEFPAKAGWGHTPMERAVDYAMLAHAKQLALFHHDPGRSDDAVDQLSESATHRVVAGHSPLQVFAAAEGQVIELSTDSPSPRSSPGSETSALLSQSPSEVSTVLIVDDDPLMVLMLQDTLRAEGMKVLTASDSESALRLARQEHPALILLDMILPGLDGLGVCRLLRAETDRRLSDVPIVMLTGVKLYERDLVEAFAAGVTDYLTKPVKPTLVRSLVRAWLLRTTDTGPELSHTNKP
jgi:CheY-like chemotaxis protein/phosphoribosyl 1,2-cyclic phosphodiesterase